MTDMRSRPELGGRHVRGLVYTCGCVYVMCVREVCEVVVGCGLWVSALLPELPRTWSQPGSFGSLSEAAMPQRALPAAFFRALELFTWERPPSARPAGFTSPPT